MRRLRLHYQNLPNCQRARYQAIRANKSQPKTRRTLDRVTGRALQPRRERLGVVDLEELRPEVEVVVQRVLHHLWSPDQLQAELGASLLFPTLMNSQSMQIKPPVAKSNLRHQPVFQATITLTWLRVPRMRVLGNLPVLAEVLYGVSRCPNITAPAASADAAFNKTHQMAQAKHLMFDHPLLLVSRSIDRITFKVAATFHGRAQQ